METKIISMSEVAEFVHSQLSPAVGILFAGDRFSCCDQGVGAFVDGQLVGIATIASEGETYDGTPTIVGLFVSPEHRCRGIGTALMRAAIEQCRERGFSGVRVDVMSTGAKKAIERLPEDLRALLDVHDLGAMLDCLP